MKFATQHGKILSFMTSWDTISTLLLSTDNKWAQKHASTGLSVMKWQPTEQIIGVASELYILPLTEKVADNVALWLIESTKAADVDMTIVLLLAW